MTTSTLCEVTGLPSYLCTHCQSGNWRPTRDAEPLEHFEISSAVFEAQYSGRCTINHSHKIKRGERVARVQFSDNPMVPVPGVACYSCIRGLGQR